MTELTLFHTAEVHRAMFDALSARIAPDAKLTHVVRPDWLDRGLHGIDAELALEIHSAIFTARNAICTCSTIGEIAARAGAMRIDWPMMQQAAAIGGPVLLAYCLESTKEPSTRLLSKAFADIGLEPNIRELPLAHLWVHFVSGDTSAFATRIAARLSQALEQAPDTACVVLAQASMAAATEHLNSGVPVLSAPESALRAALDLPPN